MLIAVLGACNPGNAEVESSDPATDDLIQQLQRELANAPAVSATYQKVKPVLKCVEKISSSTYKAHFGYASSASTPVTIPIGFFNRFWPGAINRGQPTTFNPGAVADVVQVPFNSYSASVWLLGTSLSAATRASKACPANTGTGGAGTGGAIGTGGAGGGGIGGRAAGGAGGIAGTGGAGGNTVACGSNCDDHNPCTIDACDTTSGVGVCTNIATRDGTSCSDGNACTTGDVCAAGVCGGTTKTCLASDQCHAVGICDPTSGACASPAKADGSSCTDGNACTTGDQCLSGVCTMGSPTLCQAADQCHAAGVCDASTGACSNPIAANGTTCDDTNACTTADSCTAGVCGGRPKTCPASDQCHAAGICDVASGNCTNPPVTDGTACNDGSACTTVDECQSGACVGGSPKTCVAADQCHLAGSCAPATGSCSNPAKPDGTPCNGNQSCGGSSSCEAGVCQPTTEGNCPVCTTCTADNCVPDTDGCEIYAAFPADFALCQAAYRCFTNPTNNCTNQGDPLKCWCGTNPTTCLTDNAPPTQANGPCLQQIFAAAKSTDAATIRLRFSDPAFPLGGAVNLVVCRGGFCAQECGVK